MSVGWAYIAGGTQGLGSLSARVIVASHCMNVTHLCNNEGRAMKIQLQRDSIGVWILEVAFNIILIILYSRNILQQLYFKIV